MFKQLLTPVGDSLLASFVVAALPIAIVLVLLGVLRRPAWQACLAGLAAAIVMATAVWQLPVGLALDAAANGGIFALWPIMWIVVNALLLYNIAVVSGRFESLRLWLLDNLPNDRRIVLIVVGFCFGALLEGIAGFGTPIAITSAMLILVGFAPLDALTYTLIFDTAPVAFGALGVPVTVLGQVTHLSDITLGQMIGRQLPFIALLLPFYVMGLFGGRRSLAALWPVLLVAGGSFALIQFATANLVDYKLTDVFSSLGSLVVTLLFLRVWQPAADPAYAIALRRDPRAAVATHATWAGWLPWLIVSAVVVVWTTLKIFAIGDTKIQWPGLHNAISITLYKDAPYGAIWDFQPLATGTAILLAAILTALLVRLPPAVFIAQVGVVWRQARIAILTVMLILALAFVMNYSGMAYTLGRGVASVGALFPLLSPFLGWIAVFMSGSDTSGNALFGNLQVVAANQLGLNPVLIAASNSSGGVMGKMISPQNIATGVSVTNLKGQEGLVFARTFKHSIILTFILGLLVLVQQYLTPWVIPG
ncbi:L-lactate permease [Lichenifustis flavocetrariae]|uniref:L-lactate permease n=1 Tax=Lichenifustis flavocetrariae TaxID=2949735 RepID=A0AA42CLY0_9HYPH|nr:L-lactate permease [Lichenifustis flavocetrariae]MCW6507790.1 L-lactate permease [Lichenifustis flavocetrariae]